MRFLLGLLLASLASCYLTRHVLLGGTPVGDAAAAQLSEDTANVATSWLYWAMFGTTAAAATVHKVRKHRKKKAAGATT